MHLQLALLVAALAGFLALSYEILWFRIYGFLTGGAPSSFGVVLGVYLLGIALGSLLVRRWCKDGESTGQAARLILPAWLILLATLGGWLLLPGVAELVRTHNYKFSLVGVGVVAGMTGAVLPLVAHFGIAADERAGERLSWIYLANIVGSTVGSLCTGFVLMQWLSTAQIALTLALCGLGLTALLAIAAQSSMRGRLVWAAALVAVAGAMTWQNAKVYDFLYEKLLFKQAWPQGERFAHVLENRSGVITVSQDSRIFGSGMYDGVFNTDLVDDRNMIIRAYAVSAMRPTYKDVLMIGLSSGSWAQVIANSPAVEKLTIVEINPGYPEIAKRFPGVASIFQNPKIQFVFDDGRRWLAAHPDRKFDLVVQNTTWHWRGHITNLLSQEYLALVKARLTANGVFFWNTTWSAPAQKTACGVFKHGFRLINFMAASDSEVVLDKALWRQRLEQYRVDGKPVFDLANPQHHRRLDEVLAFADRLPTGGETTDVERCESLVARMLTVPFVTDDNMATEWGRPWDAMPVGGD